MTGETQNLSITDNHHVHSRVNVMIIHLHELPLTFTYTFSSVLYYSFQQYCDFSVIMTRPIYLSQVSQTRCSQEIQAQNSSHKEDSQPRV